MEGRRGREGGREGGRGGGKGGGREGGREGGRGGGKGGRERQERKCRIQVREERDREYREQRKGRGVEDKGQWMC